MSCILQWCQPLRTTFLLLDYFKICFIPNPFIINWFFFFNCKSPVLIHKTRSYINKNNITSMLFPLDMTKTSKTSNKKTTALKIVPYVYALYKRAPNFKIKITIKCYWSSLLLYVWNQSLYFYITYISPYILYLYIPAYKKNLAYKT